VKALYRLIESIEDIVRHFTTLEHFKNLIYVLLISTLCYLTVKEFNVKREIPRDFWNIILLVTGHYFGQRNGSKVSKKNRNGDS